MDDEMTCPMCMGRVPRGAIVCRGCKARIEYGIPNWAASVVLVCSIAFGLWSGAVLTWWIGLVGGVVLFLLCSVGLQHLFRNRVVFRLRY
ncbi:unnamed protein product [Stenotrophomonas maltophilia]|nr:hypothetical protein [Stenotrophomonas maltophilia]CRX67529.1 unnamed protein product [Stenotrophomonas maltophilia]